ncbi:hypothetical protein LDB30_06580 [Acidithiobacillus ferrooxidans]|nr:hypothetical protein LDB30_06580 [Acidithiobacillus ferrooxidans]
MKGKKRCDANVTEEDVNMLQIKRLIGSAKFMKFAPELSDKGIVYAGTILIKLIRDRTHHITYSLSGQSLSKHINKPEKN